MRRAVGAERARTRRAGGERSDRRRCRLPTAALVLNDLPRQVLAKSDAAAGDAVPLEEQTQWLTERADAFAQVGEWEQAMTLLEAALLLAPDDFGLRVKLLGSYREFVGNRGAWLSNFPKQTIAAGLPRLADAYLAYFTHLEYLIRNRRLNRVQAISAISYSPHDLFWCIYRNCGAADGSVPAMRELYGRVAEAEERFMAEVYPRILQLAEERPHQGSEFRASNPELGLSGDFYPHWLAMLSHWFRHKRGINESLTSHDLDYLFRLLTEVVPENPDAPGNFTGFFVENQVLREPDKPAPDRITAEEWLAFLRRLTASNRPMLRLHGRYGLLSWRRDNLFKTKEPIQPLLADYEALLRDYRAVAAPMKKRGRQEPGDLYAAILAARRPCRPREAVERSQRAAKAAGIRD